jgi:parallel beta-helix repeat protein
MRRTIVLLATMALTLLVASGVALAAAIGPAGAQSSVVGPGESIQEAINAADPGDTIVVRGVHREDVVIRKDGIKLRGVDATLRPPERADSPCSKANGPEGICVLGDVDLEAGELTGSRVEDVSVSGFTIEDFDEVAIEAIGARNATIAGNRAVGIGDTAIGTFLSVGTKILNNVTRGPGETGIGTGIGTFEATNTLISGNDLSGHSFAEILIIDSPGTRVLSNEMGRSGVVGTVVVGQKSANAKVVGNNISGGGFGVYVADAHRGSFAGNTIHDNCAGMFFEAFPSEPVGEFEVKANTVKNNTRSCRAAQFDRNFSGIGIALLGARGMEVTANHLSGNVPSGPTPVSGGVVVAMDPFFGGTIKPMNNSVIGNHFGRNKPDIFWDESGSGNRFVGNLCDTSVPSSLCN